MPRKYANKVPTTDVFATGLAATMRPMIQLLVRETIAEMLGDWMTKNAPPRAAAPEPERAPEPSPVALDRGKANGSAKRAAEGA